MEVKDASWFWIQFNMMERETGVMVRKVCCCCLFVLFFQATQCQSIESIFLPFCSLYLHGCRGAAVSSCVTFVHIWFQKQEIAVREKEFSVWLLFSPPPPPIPFFSSCSSSFFNSGRRRFPRNPPADLILCLLARIVHSNIPLIGITSLTSRDTHLNLLPPGLPLHLKGRCAEECLLNS